MSSVGVISRTSYSFEPRVQLIQGQTTSIGCLNQHANCEADERPQKVKLASFYIGKFEVTNSQFVPFLNAMQRHRNDKGVAWIEIQSEDNDSHILYQGGEYAVEEGFEHFPVIEVSWQGATRYAQWLAHLTGKPYRLPTEAEWEYMARAGEQTQYYWGDHFKREQANCDGCSGDWGDDDHLRPVASYPPNPWGIFDVSGNVWEWTCSEYQSEYKGGESLCASVLSDNPRVLRGGSWFNEPWDLRLSNRTYQTDWHQDYLSGFRLAMSSATD